MLARVLVVALNTYREAARARILHGLFALALATTAYSLVVGAYTAKNQLRVVSDLGEPGRPATVLAGARLQRGLVDVRQLRDWHAQYQPIGRRATA